jgi:hypothetical protein
MAILDSINSAIQWLEQARRELEADQKEEDISSKSPPPSQPSADQKMAWGSKVSPTFKERVIWVADNLGCDVNHLMACMAWESGETFRADIKNAAGSGATGLIQFMPSTARGLGTTTAKLSAMSAEDQLRYVYEYFRPYVGKLNNLGDLYMAILWPKAVGKPDHFVLFDRSKTPTAFRQNAGLDVNHDGLVTRAECLVKVNGKLAKGLLPQNIG